MWFSITSGLAACKARRPPPASGFTDYFRVELAWAKLLGAVLSLALVPARLKEWAHAAFAITLGSALIAHLSIGEGPRRRGVITCHLRCLSDQSVAEIVQCGEPAFAHDHRRGCLAEGGPPQRLTALSAILLNSTSSSGETFLGRCARTLSDHFVATCSVQHARAGHHIFAIDQILA